MYRLQPNAWTCGPTALYNALTALGVPCSLFGVCKLADIPKHVNFDTTPSLRMAAGQFGVDFCTEVCTTREYARSCVRHRYPMLVCVDRDSEGPYAHWIAVVRATARHVWIADSARPGPVERRLTWLQFLDRAGMLMGGEVKYVFHPLVRRRVA